MLDTNVIIDAIEARSPPLAGRMAECDEGDLVTSVIAYSEAALGSVHGKPPPLQVLDAFLEDIPVLDFDRDAALAYAALPFKRGRFDRLIAAHALSRDLIVVTDNEQDFRDVPGLRVENWTTT